MRVVALLLLLLLLLLEVMVTPVGLEVEGLAFLEMTTKQTL